MKLLNGAIAGLFITLAIFCACGRLYASLHESAWFLCWALRITAGSPVEVRAIFDLFSLLFMARVFLIAGRVLLFSWSYIGTEPYFLRFHLLVLSFVFSILLLIVSPNLIRILLGWDGLGVTSYLLVMYYNSAKSSNAALLTALRNRVGDVCVVAGVAFLRLRGSWNLLFRGHSLSLYLRVIIVMGRFTKRAQIPFSAWLPAAIAAPTPVSALVHSSTLVTAGVYLLFRFRGLLVRTATHTYFVFFGILTIIMAGIRAMHETDMKKIVALSTLSQLGLMVSTLGLGLSQLAFFHLLSHAYFKAILFIAVGNIIHCRNSYQDIRIAGNLSRAMPLRHAFFNLANLSLCGFPFMAGFYSKDLILEEVLIGQVNFTSVLIFFAATLLTAAYSTRLTYLTSLRETSGSALLWSSDNDALIVRGIKALAPLAVAAGPLLRLFLLPNFYLSFLPLILKLLAFLVTVGGVGLGLSYFNSSKSLLTWSQGAIWLLPLISTRLLRHSFLNLSHSSRLLDLTWLEWTATFFRTARGQRTLAVRRIISSSALLVQLKLILLWGALSLLLYLCITNFFESLKFKILYALHLYITK